MTAWRTTGAGAMALLLAVTGASGALAQSAAAAPAPAALDPARLAEAHKLIDILQPPATRERVTKARVDMMMGNILKMVREDPTLAAQTGDPKIKALADTYVGDMFKMISDDLGTSMPALYEAMARAYARRLSVPELQASEQFFASASGRAYVDSANDILSDPDFIAVQRDMMQRMATRIPEMMAKMKQDVAAAVAAGAKKQARSG